MPPTHLSLAFNIDQSIVVLCTDGFDLVDVNMLLLHPWGKMKEQKESKESKKGQLKTFWGETTYVSRCNISEGCESK